LISVKGCLFGSLFLYDLSGNAEIWSMESFCSFLCLPKETNQRKGTQGTGPAIGGMPCAPQNCRDVANSLRSNSATSLFGSFSGARLRADGNFLPPFVLPRLADGGGKDAGTV
jgi:hypothetical protein